VRKVLLCSHCSKNMQVQKHPDLNSFFVAGISYKKADASIRGKYAVSHDQNIELFKQAGQLNIAEFFVLSTCNRTEIYGFAENPESLAKLLCLSSPGSFESFLDIAYVKNGREAVEHLFHVAAGLDSQILGDYEIIGQIKKAAKLSKEYGFVNAYLERMLNGVLQASKEIKTSTALSGGTVSVSFAAIQCIRSYTADTASKKFLLIGTGKIGRSTTRNLVDYLGAKDITLVNRTAEKARVLATELGIRHAAIDELANEITKADIILTATTSDKPIIVASSLKAGKPVLIIDLSVPNNVDPACGLVDAVQLVNVDGLSRMKDDTLHKREEEIPAALSIIEQHVDEFYEWHSMRRHVPVLKAVKSKLEELYNSDMFPGYSAPAIAAPSKSRERIQRALNGMAVKMRERELHGCCYIETMNEFIGAAFK
jgi:glutamyl-tRNA reductase